MSLADTLRADAKRLRSLQTRAWDLETLVRFKRRRAARLADHAHALRVEAGQADEKARALRQSARLFEGEGLTRRIEFLEAQADAADAEERDR